MHERTDGNRTPTNSRFIRRHFLPRLLPAPGPSAPCGRPLCSVRTPREVPSDESGCAFGRVGMCLRTSCRFFSLQIICLSGIKCLSLQGMEKKETIPSYKRRLNDWDYSQPRIYMLTLATEGRLPLLGTLVGDVTLPTTAPNGPRLLPSELGAAVLQEVDGIPRYYPQITIITRQLMPDHLHILLYVKRPLPVHLGQVVAGFKAGCNKKWRLMQGEAQGRGTLWQKTQWQKTQWQSHCAPDPVSGRSTVGGPVPGGSAAGPVPGSSAAGLVPGSSAARTKGLLWEQGYHDRVLSGEGQLQRLSTTSAKTRGAALSGGSMPTGSVLLPSLRPVPPSMLLETWNCFVPLNGRQCASPLASQKKNATVNSMSCYLLPVKVPSSFLLSSVLVSVLWKKQPCRSTCP